MNDVWEAFAEAVAWAFCIYAALGIAVWVLVVLVRG